MKGSPFEPMNPEKFSRDLADEDQSADERPIAAGAIRQSRPQTRRRNFSWSKIAEKTKALYRTLIKA